MGMMAQGQKPLRRGSVLANFLRETQEYLLIPGAWLAFTSPLWGTGAGLLLRWPWWLVVGLALAPLTALLFAGALDEALAGLSLRLARHRSSLELATIILYLGLFLGLPLSGHYFIGW